MFASASGSASAAAVEAIPYKRIIKTRVGRTCVDYDLASWTRLMQQPRRDWSAEASGIPLSAVRVAALECGREFLRRGSDDSGLGEATNEDFLRRLGAMHTDGSLTNAGALLFVLRPDPALDYIRRLAPGGDSLLRVRNPEVSVLEQLREVELAFRSSNTIAHVPAGLATAQIPALPFRAFRQSVVNRLAHRSWTLAEATIVEHVGSTVTVTSPGGLPAGVTPENIITHPSLPPNRLLAEILAKLRIAEREGIGIDRMVGDMLAQGHDLPVISEEAGPMVRVALLGGDPDAEWLALLSRLRPADAVANLDYLLLLKTVLTVGWLDAASATKPLQKSAPECLHALRGLSAVATDTEPVLTQVKGIPVESPPAWRPSRALRRATPKATKVLQAPRNRANVARMWANARGRVSSNELADLVQTQANYAGRVLKDLQEEGELRGSSDSGMGRGFHYIPVIRPQG